VNRWARRYVLSRRAHPFAWLVVDAVEGAAMTTVLWLSVGAIAGIVFACSWGALSVFGLFGRRIQRRHAERRVGVTLRLITDVGPSMSHSPPRPTCAGAAHRRRPTEHDRRRVVMARASARAGLVGGWLSGGRAAILRRLRNHCAEVPGYPHQRPSWLSWRSCAVAKATRPPRTITAAVASTHPPHRS
jgi:hypothetical protein